MLNLLSKIYGQVYGMNLSNSSTCFVLLTFTAFIFYFFIGFYFLLLNAKNNLNIVFTFLSISLGIWSFAFTFFYTAETKQLADFWYKFAALGYCAYFALALHFSLLLTNRRFKFKHKYFISFIYIPSLIFYVNALINNLAAKDFVSENGVWNQVISKTNLWFWLYVIVTLIYLILSFYKIYMWGKLSLSQREKNQSKAILISGIIPVILGSITNFLFPIFSLRLIPSISQILMLSFIIGIWYSIKKYRLMSLTAEIAANEILSKIIDMIILTDNSNKITKINESLLHILGFKEHELLDKNIIFLFSNDELYISEEKKHSAKLTSKTGIIIPVKISISKIYDDKILLGRVYIIQDMRHIELLQSEINEKIHLTQSLIETNEKLKELDKLKSDFLSTVSHELRTPLTSVLGFAKIVQKKLNKDIFAILPMDDARIAKASKQINDNLDIILSEGDRLTNLINDVLDLAKMEAGKIEWKFDYISIESIITQGITSVYPLYNQKNILIKYESLKNLPQLYCDKDRILQVLINLLSNAIKFSNINSTITCTATVIENLMRITVSDEGIGISEENLTKVFERFQQIGDTLTDKPVGTGLGLPICKQIIEFHKGNIWVESQPKAGSKFIFTIPMINDNTFPLNHKKLSNPVSLEKASITIKSNKILIVDDEIKIVNLIQQTLEEKGFEVIGTTESVDTLSIAKRERPDLILLDIMMPKISGFDVVAMLKNNPETKNIPVFLLTIVEERERAQAIGVDGYFTKPIDFEELIDGILAKLLKKY